MVNACKLASILAGGLLVANLLMGGHNMPFSHSPLFFRPWPCGDTTLAVKTGVVYSGVIVYYHGTVNIGVMYNGSIYTGNRRIVHKVATAPVPAIVAGTPITKTIINTAVKADMRSPVTGVKSVNPAFISPVAGRPQKTWLGR